MTFILVQTETQATNDSLLAKPSNGISTGMLFSSNGLGIHLSKTLGQKGICALKLSASYLPYTLNNFVINVDGSNINLNANSSTGFKLKLNGKIELGSANLSAEIHPFKNAFKITAGAALMVSRIDLIATPRDSLKQGDVSLGPDEQGEIFFGLTVPNLCPYLGIGFGRAVPKKRVGLNFEIGSYYIGSPKLAFRTTGMLEPTSSEEKKLNNNLKTYYALPVITLGINIRLSK